MSSWWSNVTQKVKNWWKSSDDERDAYSGMVHIRDENARIGFSKFRDRLAAGFPSRGNSLRPDPEKAIAVRLKSEDPDEDRYFVRASGHLGAPVMMVRFPKFKPMGVRMY